MWTEQIALLPERRENDLVLFMYMNIPCHLSDWGGWGSQKIKERSSKCCNRGWKSAAVSGPLSNGID